VLAELRMAAREDGHPLENSQTETRFENQLVKGRLGAATGLFVALRLRHAGTAAHSLRIAVAASGWASFRGLDEATRDLLEVAALLHDIGKLGIADKVLLKPGRLDPAEADIMQQHRRMATEMLTAAGAPTAVIDTIVASAARFDGSDDSLPLAGQQIPLPARMLAILDAWDSMTSHHVWRRAFSRERALSELFACAGQQFDPELVEQFAQLVGTHNTLLDRGVASRWLNGLRDNDDHWQPRSVKQGANASLEALFEHNFIRQMHHGVVFVDSQCRIVQWNQGCERLTGVQASAAVGREWSPGLLQMATNDGKPLADSDCPAARAIASGSPVFERVELVGRSGRRMKVDLHAMPVADQRGTPQGATIFLQDASSEVTLEERCRTLHAEMTRDPLTQVANRAEFDRVLALFIDAHQDTGLPCSLIMCDIDYFKSVNDTYGHQAGDQAIISFAKLLKSMCRSGDLVARYGGEEFAVLCADCDIATAAARGELIRKRLTEMTHPELGNNSFTASFGVSELQAGDTPESMLRRSDRALMEAKQQGRNQVVQLGDGMMDEPKRRGWLPWGLGSSNRTLIETTLCSNVPIDLAIQKLQGFISDHAAKILKVTDEQVRLELPDSPCRGSRKDRAVPFFVEVKFAQQHHQRTNAAGLAAGVYVETLAEVSISPRRDRDRRNGTAAERARLLLVSLKSYLMARELVDPPYETAGK
jgi:diguanylate cyclase (GGDEF)-like protein/putative nucleotidyltransferase with HDIG domain/PAS domain S-box-containing protein